jgi:hypothetical protein
VLISIVSLSSQTMAQQPLNVGFTSIYDFEDLLPENQYHTVWKGEMLLMVLKIESDANQDIHIEVSKQEDGIEIEIFELAYVLADFSAGFCGTDKAEGEFRKGRIPDRATKISDNKYTTDSTASFVLLRVEIDESIRRGDYPITIEVRQKDIAREVGAEIRVVNRRLPSLSSLDFRMDFWQYPMAVADYYSVIPWSEEHFNYLEEMFKQLKGINQKVVTTSVFWDPYNNRIREASEWMIQITKTKEGDFFYDYSNFEKYVKLAFSEGVDKQIAVHNLYPWNNNFFYYDENTKKIVTVNSLPNSPEHHAFWKPFLENFERYLHALGWLDKVMFYVDERNPEITIELAKFIMGINQDYKLGYAGAFHAKLSPYIFDYSIPSNVTLGDYQLRTRRRAGHITTFYTACFDKGANMLMTSSNVDTYFLLMLARAKGFDGMLRWAFNQWTASITENAIYSHVPSGDAHFVYPNNQPSLRYFLIQDGLEELLKVQRKSSRPRTRRILNRYTDNTLLRNQGGRIDVVERTKKYLND